MSGCKSPRERRNGSTFRSSREIVSNVAPYRRYTSWQTSYGIHENCVFINEMIVGSWIKIQLDHRVRRYTRVTSTSSYHSSSPVSRVVGLVCRNIRARKKEHFCQGWRRVHGCMRIGVCVICVSYFTHGGRSIGIALHSGTLCRLYASLVSPWVHLPSRKTRDR